MQKHILMVIAIVMFVMILCSCCERINTGYEVVLVNLYGSDNPNEDVRLVTGMVWYKPWTQTIYEYPTYIQTIDYPAFGVNSKDGLEFTVDPTISMSVIEGKSISIFRKYRKDLTDITGGPMFNVVRDVFRTQLNSLTAKEIVFMRDSLERVLKGNMVVALKREGFLLDNLTSGLQYPESIKDAINAQKIIFEDLACGNEPSQ